MENKKWTDSDLRTAFEDSCKFVDLADLQDFLLKRRQLAKTSEGQLTIPAVFSSEDMISFGNFIRDNYYGVGAPKLISYDPVKYPHGTIEDIFVIWSCLNGR